MFENSNSDRNSDSGLTMEINTDKELFHKIIDLFDYRMFPQLLEKINQPEHEKNMFYDKLILLQSSIYYLDAHLEKNWQVNYLNRLSSWDDIFARLRPFLQVDSESEDYVRHIQKYEKHEMALRQNIWPTRYSMTYFYFYKSCDVKLLRRLIYEYGNLESILGSTAKWRYFDFITEVNDDITDIFEDMPLYNGNRFLLHLLRDGKKEAENTFLSFIQEIELIANNKVAKASTGEIDADIHEETMAQCIATRKKLGEVLDRVDLDNLLKESALAKHLMP